MGKKETSMPDQSSAMIAMSQQSAMANMRQSDVMYGLGMSQIGASIMQTQGMFVLGSSQIQANLDLGHERLENSLEIARMNYDLRSQDLEDAHGEKMAELQVRKHEIDMEAQTGNQIDTSDFTT